MQERERQGAGAAWPTQPGARATAAPPASRVHAAALEAPAGAPPCARGPAGLGSAGAGGGGNENGVLGEATNILAAADGARRKYAAEVEALKARACTSITAFSAWRSCVDRPRTAWQAFGLASSSTAPEGTHRGLHNHMPTEG